MNRDNTKPFIIGLLVVQAGVSVSLWILNPLSSTSTTAFALLLAADVVVFGGICHLYFSVDDQDAERTMFGAAPVPETVEAHETPPVPPQPLFDMPSVTSRRVRIAVPVFSIITLLSLAALVASGEGTTFVFIPVFLTMVIVYVLASIYLFKTMYDKEKESTGQGVALDHGAHEGH
jgi:hypothetical protein